MNFWNTLNKPFTVLAPMEDVTDVVFRELISQLAPPDVFFTEFTSIDGLLSKQGYEYTLQGLRYTEHQRPIVAQIWGTDPDSFFTVAKMVADMGFDGIDINMGCPVRKITNSGACSALINTPDLAVEIIKATKDGAGGIPVSVKTRIGYGRVNTQGWITTLLQQHIHALTVHGRIAKQMSRGEADWNEVRKVVILRDQIAPGTTIIGNGDVKNYAEVLVKSDEFGVDGVMIGRAIFQNPWVFSKKKSQTEHTKQERLNLLLKHMDMFCNQWDISNRWKPDSKNFAVLKKFFKIYIKGFKGAAELRNKVMLVNTPEEVRAIVNECL